MKNKHFIDSILIIALILTVVLSVSLIETIFSSNRNITTNQEIDHEASHEASEQFKPFIVKNDNLINPEILFYTIGGNTASFLFLQSSVIMANIPDHTQPVHLVFQRTHPTVDISSQARQPGVLNLFKGNDPSQWKSGVAAYQSVSYDNLYPGINLEYAAEHAGLKGTFRVSPGSDPGKIRWNYTGISDTRVNPDTGDLELSTTTNEPGQSPGLIIEQAPTAWQEIDGKKIDIPVSYQIEEDLSVGFAVGDYDIGFELVIDPRLITSSYVGGNKDEEPQIVIGQDGDIYLFGNTSSTDFPENPVKFGPGGGYRDLFLIKIDSITHQTVFSTLIGGSGDDRAMMSFGHDGSIFIAGESASDDFPVINPIQSSRNGSYNNLIFLRLNPNGDQILFSSYLGGTGGEYFKDFEVDSENQLIFTGMTNSSDLPIINAFDDSLSGESDVVLGKINTETSKISFLTYFGGDRVDRADDIEIGIEEDLFIIGVTQSADFPVVNPYQATYQGNWDLFISKFDKTATNLHFSTFLGAPTLEDDSAFALDQEDNIFILGRTYPGQDGVNFPIKNAYEPFHYSAADIVFAKMKPDGSDLLFSSYISGQDNEQLGAIKVGPKGDVYVAFISGSACLPGYSFEKSSGYLMTFTPNSSKPSSIIHIPQTSFLFSLGFDPTGDYFLSGNTTSSSFPLLNAPDTVYDGFIEGFWIQFSDSPEPPPGSHRLYMPFLSNPEPNLGIYGAITYFDCPIKDIPVELRFYDGDEWHTISSTITDQDGIYLFKNIPSIPEGQYYYVLFNNTLEKTNYVGAYASPLLTAYQAGSNVFMGFGEIQGINLNQPENEVIINVPYQFSWTRRNTRHGSDYEFNLASTDLRLYWYTDPSLGDVNNYTLTSLPKDFKKDQWYIWYMGVYDLYGGYANSYYARYVRFENTGRESQVFESTSTQPKDMRWTDPLFIPHPP